jgi:hypoxanthine phosphoribosyltransferase
VMKGSIVFLSDLMRQIGIPLEIDLVCVSSYGQGARSAGQIELLKDLSVDIRGRHVLLIEDIVDTGVTLSRLRQLFLQRDPASVAICALLSKPERREVDVPLTYTGFQIPDEFVVGYGLDYAEHYRHLPFVAVLKPEVYA